MRDLALEGTNPLLREFVSSSESRASWLLFLSESLSKSSDMRSNSDNLSIRSDNDNGGFHVASLSLLSLLRLLAAIDQLSAIADNDGDIVNDLDLDLGDENLNGEKLGVRPRVDRLLFVSSSDKTLIRRAGGLAERVLDLANWDRSLSARRRAPLSLLFLLFSPLRLLSSKNSFLVFLKSSGTKLSTNLSI